VTVITQAANDKDLSSMNNLHQQPIVQQPQRPILPPSRSTPVAGGTPEITYRGAIITFGSVTFRNIEACRIVAGIEEVQTLKPRLDLSNWRNGIDWGENNGCSYAAALALLAHATGSDEMALRYFKLFGKCVIAKLPHGEWKMTRHQVLRKLEELQEWEQRQAAGKRHAKRGR
jgi:hypothetical protein